MIGWYLLNRGILSMLRLLIGVAVVTASVETSFRSGKTKVQSLLPPNFWANSLTRTWTSFTKFLSDITSPSENPNRPQASWRLDGLYVAAWQSMIRELPIAAERCIVRHFVDALMGSSRYYDPALRQLRCQLHFVCDKFARRPDRTDLLPRCHRLADCAFHPYKASALRFFEHTHEGLSPWDAEPLAAWPFLREVVGDDWLVGSRWLLQHTLSMHQARTECRFIKDSIDKYWRSADQKYRGNRIAMSGLLLSMQLWEQTTSTLAFLRLQLAIQTTHHPWEVILQKCVLPNRRFDLYQPLIEPYLASTFMAAAKRTRTRIRPLRKLRPLFSSWSALLQGVQIDMARLSLTLIDAGENCSTSGHLLAHAAQVLSVGFALVDLAEHQHPFDGGDEGSADNLHWRLAGIESTLRAQLVLISGDIQQESVEEVASSSA